MSINSCKYAPLNEEDATAVREMFSDPEVSYALNLIRNLTMATGIEHGVLIFRTDTGYRVSNGFRGNSRDMGWNFFIAHLGYIQDGMAPVATAHGHPGRHPAQFNPSNISRLRGDIGYNARTNSIGIVASRRGFTAGRVCE